MDADIVVVGSGVAGLTAAIVAAVAGKKVILLEKTDFFGGTSAWSGGVAWVPGNHFMAEAGIHDTAEQAMNYITSIMGEFTGRNKISLFLEKGPEAIAFLERNTSAMRFVSYPGPDYFPHLPGALSHRGVMPLPYDGRELGRYFKYLQWPLRQLVMFQSMQVDATDVHHLQNSFRSWNSLARSARLLVRYALDRIQLRRGARLIRGSALVARLLKSALDLGITLIPKAEVESIELTDPRRKSISVNINGRTQELGVRDGIILATGGFSADISMRKRLIPFPEQHQSMLPDSNSGDGIRLAQQNGGVIGENKADNAIWVPVSVLKKRDGTTVKYPHFAFDRIKPGSLMVGQDGRRFTNEANCYHDVVKAMHNQSVVPAYLIGDRRFLRRYGMGLARPAPYSVRGLIEQGYLFEAPTLQALASLLDIDAHGLVASVQQMNEAAQSGVDSAFGRGGNSYNQSLGDPENRPNPCLGRIGKPPFYAVKLFPGDAGTTTGLQVDSNARVLSDDGKPIEGLYACGLDIDSIFRGFYPGAGAMHGPNITFAYIAALHVTSGNQIARNHVRDIPRTTK